MVSINFMDSIYILTTSNTLFSLCLGTLVYMWCHLFFCFSPSYSFLSIDVSPIWLHFRLYISTCTCLWENKRCICFILSIIHFSESRNMNSTWYVQCILLFLFLLFTYLSEKRKWDFPLLSNKWTQELWNIQNNLWKLKHSSDLSFGTL